MKKLDRFVKNDVVDRLDVGGLQNGVTDFVDQVEVARIAVGANQPAFQNQDIFLFSPLVFDRIGKLPHHENAAAFLVQAFKPGNRHLFQIKTGAMVFNTKFNLTRIELKKTGDKTVSFQFKAVFDGVGHCFSHRSDKIVAELAGQNGGLLFFLNCIQRLLYGGKNFG